jgi:hypothetical protein
VWREAAQGHGVASELLLGWCASLAMEAWMLIDLTKVVGMVGEQTIAEIGEPLGLSKEQSVKAANALARNFTGANKDEAVAAAAAETGITQEVMNTMAAKLIDRGKDFAVEAAKGELGKQAKGLFGKFFGG